MKLMDAEESNETVLQETLTTRSLGNRMRQCLATSSVPCVEEREKLEHLVSKGGIKGKCSRRKQ